MTIKRLDNAADLVLIRHAANLLGVDMISLYEAKELWEKISSSHHAQWLTTCDDVERVQGLISEWIEGQE